MGDVHASFSARRPLLATVAAAALLGSTLIASPAAATQPVPPTNPEIRGTESLEPATDRFIVTFRDTAEISSTNRNQAYDAAAAALGAEATELFRTGAGASVITVDKDLSATEADALVASLSEAPAVEHVERDVLLAPASITPDDEFYNYQWNLWESVGGVNAPAAWEITEGENQVVAVIDTGITAHRDLTPAVLPGYDLISEPAMARDGDGRDPDPQDEGDWSDGSICDARNSTWHGTHVAGTVAATGNNGMGISGVAPAAKIVPVRVLGECGGYMSDIADGIIWAAGGELPGIPVNPNPANVINLSLGGRSPCSAYMQGAVDYANSRNAVVVVAAGNNNEPVANQQPANCENIIAVGATGPTGSRAYYSNYGAGIDIMAPGGVTTHSLYDGILSTLDMGLTVSEPEYEFYAFYQGTSMAAPHVAGAAALLLSMKPQWTPAQVEAHLKATARPLPNGCYPYCGPELLDMGAAVAVPLTAAPVPTISGNTTAGSTLTAVPGTWAPHPVTLTYAWFRGNTLVPQATGPEYALTAADVGRTIRVEVTGTKPGYSRSVRSSAPTAPVAVPFADVPVGTVFFDEMAWLAATGISTGWTEANGTRTYRPLQPVNRDVMAAFMYRLAGSPEFTAPPTSPFADVPTDHVFYKEITWLASTGISKGWTEAVGRPTYRPLQPVNRDVMAAFMYRLAGSPEFTAPRTSPFADVPTNHVFYKEITWLASTGISTGWNEPAGRPTYRPVRAVNRDVMAAFMYRFDAQFRP